MKREICGSRKIDRLVAAAQQHELDDGAIFSCLLLDRGIVPPLHK